MAQEQDPERENEKDTECSREKAERVQSPESTLAQKATNSGCKPEFSRDTCDRREVLRSFTFSFYFKRIN